MNKKLVKVISVTLTVMMLFSSISVCSFAATDTFETAVEADFGIKYEGRIRGSNPKNFYKFTLDEDAELTIDMVIYINTICYLYDENGVQLWKEEGYRGENGLSALTYNFDLEAGIYYFCVTGNNWVGDYTIKFTAESVEVPSIEPTDDCSCNCHKSGITRFFFDFILIFQKLFGTNKVCSCGVTHY